MKKIGRPRSKTNRFLPEFVYAYKDRHGKVRHRFRRKGFADYHFKAQLGTEEFRTEYRACMDGAMPKPVEERHEPGTFNDLIAKYYASPRWNARKRSHATRQHDRRIIESVRPQIGHRPVAGMTFAHCEALLLAKVNTPTAANKLRKQLKRLLGYAIALGMRANNPMDETQPLEVEGSGHHTWSEEEIDRFTEKHPLGTKAYLAMMLMLWTGARRSDAVKLGRGNIKDGWISFITTKNKKLAKMPVAQPLLEAILAAADTKGFTFLVTAYGQPFTRDGFGNKMRQWCDEAGLPNCTSHGLRKAIARRMAELGLSNQQMKAVCTWSGDSEVALYTKEADQAAMAKQAMDRLSAWTLTNHAQGLAKGSENNG